MLDFKCVLLVYVFVFLSLPALTKLSKFGKNPFFTVIYWPSSPFLPISTHICVFFYKYIRRICISSACFHQIFPNASDQISLALFCTFRERGWEGGRVDARRRLPAALWLLRKYQDEITPSFSPSFLHRWQNGITAGDGRGCVGICDILPPAEIYLPSAG